MTKFEEWSEKGYQDFKDEEAVFCDRCDKRIKGNTYWIADEPHCEDCMASLEAHYLNQEAE